MPTQEDLEEEELDEALMSPAAKLLKLGAEDTVNNITNYLLHFLGRELEQVIYNFFSILKQTKLTIVNIIS